MSRSTSITELHSNGFPQAQSGVSSAVIEIDQQRAIQEVQASLVIAQRFPRDENQSFTKVMEACKRQSLAESAMYVFNRGGQEVSGPSIRLAEMIAQKWRNIEYGQRILHQTDTYTEAEAYAWDKETNVRIVRQFTVPHIRYTRSGSKPLSDPRDIYELVANNGARRLRACILAVIPGDVIDAAIAQCEKTLREGSGEPLTDRIRTMLSMFAEFGVQQQHIEKKVGHKADAINEQELVNLKKIYRSLRDGMGHREDFFDLSVSVDDLGKGKQTAEKNPEEKPSQASQQRRQPKEQAASYSEPRGEEASDEIRRTEVHDSMPADHPAAGASDFSDNQFDF